MRKLDINELPKWSAWPARLLGHDVFDKQNRTIEKIKTEYDEDKWKRCLDLYKESGEQLDPIDLRFSISDVSNDEEVSAVLDGELIAINKHELVKKLFNILHDAISPYYEKCNSVVELGSAFGTNLWALYNRCQDVKYIGGDYSQNAVELANLLYSSYENISVEKFNYYENKYDIFENLTEPVTVFTSQSIEQLPSVETVLETLTQYREKIKAVINLEPAYDLHDDSLIGLMRKRYLQINDYNRDLISQLEKRSSEIELIDIKKDIIAFVPFNSLSLVQWKFK